MLANIFHECDLLVAECLRLGWLDGVDAPVLAGLLSTFVYEHRSPDPPAPPWFPDAAARERWRLVAATSEDLAAGERAGGLAPHRPPDAGFFGAAHGWTAGHDLEAVVGADELTGGDFVRSMKQVIDLARQVADVAPVAATRDAAPQGRPQRVPGHRRRRHRGGGGDRRAVTIRPGRAWGEPTAPPDHAAGGASRRRPGGRGGPARASPAAGPWRRRPHRARRAAGAGDHPPRPRRDARRGRRVQRRRGRPRAGPAAGAARMVARSARRRDQRRPRRGVGRGARAPIPATVGSTSSRWRRRCRCGRAGRRGGACRPAPTCRTPTSPCAGSSAPSWRSPEPLGLWVDGVARGRASSVSVWLEPDAVDVYV